jgi:tetratricopeptide (TPR) repeat protein
MTQFPESVTTSNEDTYESLISPIENNNEATYESLISLIENSQQQLALIIVACDDLALRQRTIDRYEQEAKQSQIRAERIVLGMEPSLRAGLAKLGIENQDGVVVTVTGSEWLLRVKTRAADAQSDLDKFFGYLQWTREGLREFRYPVVLWVTLPMLQEMSRRAPDFWSWRKAVLRFESEASEESLAKPALGAIVPVVRDLNPPERLFDRESNDDFIPPPAEILSEIHQLESNNPTSPNLATLYAKLAEIYAKRIARGEATDLEFEQQQAIEAFEKAIDRYRELNKQSTLASTLLQFGNFLCTLSLCRDAIQIYQQSLDIWRKIGDPYGEAMSLNNLGYASKFLGQYQKAIEFQQQSLEIQHEIGDLSGKANSLNNLGSIYGSIGQYQQAIEILQQSLNIQRELVDLHGQASSLNNLGLVFDLIGQYQQAIEFYQQSLEIRHKIKDRNGEAGSLNNLGNIYKSIRQYQRAIEFHQKSLDIQREIKDRSGEAGSLNNLGLAYASLGEYQQAIDFYQQSLKIKRELSDINGEANSLGNLGFAYESLGEYQQAIYFYQQCLEIKHKLGDHHGEAIALFDKACAISQYENRQLEAIEIFKQAREIYTELKLDDKVKKCNEAIDTFDRIKAR